MRTAVSVMLIAAGFRPLSGQPVEIRGYFESQLTAARVHAEDLQLQSNKLRIDFDKKTDRIKFGANLNAITYHGKTEWTIPDFLPDAVVGEIPPAMRSWYQMPFNDSFMLDNAWALVSFPLFDITAGKQQISTGSGYAWNPTDLFNQKDLFDPVYEQPGHNAVRLDVPLAGRLNVTALYAPADNRELSARLLYVKAGCGHFDLTLMSAEKPRITHDYLAFSGSGFMETAQKRRIFGGSLTGECLGLGVWAEAAFHRMQQSDDFHELVFGLNYTFDTQTFVMLEYYRNSLGKSDSRDYRLNDWMRYLASEQKALNRHQVYMLIQHPVSDLTQTGLSMILAGDGSLILLPSITASPDENLEITGYINYYIGKETAVFNKKLGNGGVIRLRLYF